MARCVPCKRTFPEEWLLEAHNSQFHPSVRCTDPSCPRTFTRRAVMISHFKVDHMREPSMACKHCGYAYDLSYDLFAHEQRCVTRSEEERIQYMLDHMSYDPRLALPAATTTVAAPPRGNTPPPPPTAVPKVKVVTPLTFVRPKYAPVASEPYRPWPSTHGVRGTEPARIAAHPSMFAPYRAPLPPPPSSKDVSDAQILSNALAVANRDNAAATNVRGSFVGPSSPLVVTLYDKEFVHANDLLSLEEGEWLISVVINATMLLIHDEEVPQRYKDLIHCATLDFYNIGERINSGNGEDFRHRLKLTTKEWIFFPVRAMDSLHWALIVVNVTKRTIEYADSLGASGTTAMHQIEDFLLKDELIHYPERVEQHMRKWWLINRYRSVPQQTNGNDCGVFACETARHWIRHVTQTPGHTSPEVFGYSAKDIPNIRRRMQLDLIRVGRAQARLRPPPQATRGGGGGRDEPPGSPEVQIVPPPDPFAFMSA